MAENLLSNSFPPGVLQKLILTPPVGFRHLLSEDITIYMLKTSVETTSMLNRLNFEYEECWILYTVHSELLIKGVVYVM